MRFLGTIVVGEALRLTISKEKALQICEDVLRCPLRYGGEPQNPPSEHFCTYHVEYGHTTHDCKGFKRELTRIKEEHPQLQLLLESESPRHIISMSFLLVQSTQVKVN